MKRWEYKIVECRFSLQVATESHEKTLDFYGERGWELVGPPIIDDEGVRFYYFKREIEEITERDIRQFREEAPIQH